MSGFFRWICKCVYLSNLQACVHSNNLQASLFSFEQCDRAINRLRQMRLRGFDESSFWTIGPFRNKSHWKIVLMRHNQGLGTAGSRRWSNVKSENQPKKRNLWCGTSHINSARAETGSKICSCRCRRSWPRFYKSPCLSLPEPLFINWKKCQKRCA